MKKPMPALSKALLVASTLLLGACAGETTSPKAVRAAPLEATKALVGAVDAVYTYTINPQVANTLSFGASRLTLPRQAICRLATTSYGPDFWNRECDDEERMVTITAVVRNALTNKPSIEFAPAMRFSPDANVQLYLKVDNAATLSSLATVLYCGPFSTLCVDESLSDASLRTTIDPTNNTVSRRIKHFSGYTVAERSGPDISTP